MSLAGADLYSPLEISRAAGVPLADVRRAFSTAGIADAYVPYETAIRIGRALVRQADERTLAANPPQPRAPLFALVERSGSTRQPLIPLAVSSTVHVGIAGLFVLLASWNVAPRAAALRLDDHATDPMRLVFLNIPGPGGGGGGGGLSQKTPPAKAMREGPKRPGVPLPVKIETKPIVPTPTPPLKSEQLPVVVAPIVTAPADPRDRLGVIEPTPAQVESRGPGTSGGAGTGAGGGIGSGSGDGIGPGSGGGTGGGPYRPGSGIQPPRLLHEVKADYTEEARQRNINGEVVLEIVIRRDGTVGDVRILKGLGGGLNERAAQAVRQWRFSPATRQGTAVDVIVEVSVEFKMR